VKDLKVEVTKERVEKGKYLANHVMVALIAIRKEIGQNIPGQ